MTIRRTPQDFRVEEILRPDTTQALRPSSSRDAAHAVYALTKTSLTTLEAVAKLAKALNVKVGAIEYAGLKDKHAVTIQHVSVRVTSGAAARALPDHTTTDVVESTRLGFLPRHLSAADIDRNRFTIIVRDLSEAASTEMDARAAALTSAPSTLAIINYFGDQRFGSARAGEGFIAPHLVRGEFEQALRLAIATPARKDSKRVKETARAIAGAWGRWHSLVESLPRSPNKRAIEVLAAGGSFRDAFAALPYFFQQMCVEAYQSLLWNVVARRMVEQLAGPAAHESPAPILKADDTFGELLFPGAAQLPSTWRDLEIPTLAPEVAAVAPWADAVTAVLADEGLTLAQLEIPGLRRPAFRAAPRPLVVSAAAFELLPAESDELSPKRLKRTLRFDLPRGAYATIVLRALGQ